MSMQNPSHAVAPVMGPEFVIAPPDLPVLRDIEALEDVVLVITASRKPQESYDAMLPHGRKVLAPSFLHVVSRDEAPCEGRSGRDGTF
jgi:hypothetical protein